MKALHLRLFMAAILGIPGGVFAVHPGDTPLPTLEELFPKIVERAKKESANDRQFDSSYFYIRSKVTEFRDGDGDVKKHEAKTTTNDPALKLLSAKPRPARATSRPKPASETNSKVRGRQFEEDEFIVNRDLVKRFDFKMVGRELLNQRPMLVIEFEPKQGKLPERNLKDKFINKAAGRVWLDEEDYALAKADLRLIDRVNVLGGLVGVIRKFTYGFERERTADGLWFTRDEKWHLEGREVLFERTVDFHAERSGVRKAEQAISASAQR